MAIDLLQIKRNNNYSIDNPNKEALRRLFRNKADVIGIFIIFILILTAIFANLIMTHTYDKQSLREQNKVPYWVNIIFPSQKDYAQVTKKHLIGTDSLGRDMFSRLVMGSRVSLTVAVFAPILSLLIGIVFGSIAGYFGGKVDSIMMRIVDILYAFPSLLFIILLMTFFKGASNAEQGSFVYYVNQIDVKLNGILFIFVGIGLTSWQTMARLTRAQVLSTKNKEYVEAARALGATDKRIIFKHILPNVIGTLIVSETLAIPGYISTEAFLSFIGIGVNPPMPSWGAMISDGSKVIRSYPYQAIFPAVILALTMFAFNFLGDGLRDALDTRLKNLQ